MKKPPAARLWKSDQPLDLELGGRIQEVEVAYETWGTLDADGDNAILLCPAFSAHCHARSSSRDPRPGWWEDMIGPSRALDTDRFWVVCTSLLGGCYGTTGPRSVDPVSGVSYGPRFPIVTIRDIVEVQIRLLDHLGIHRAHAALGGSLGGMESLELGLRFPQRFGRIITISATGRTQPYTATIRHIGRRAIMTDPEFREGEYGDRQPATGLRLARELGTIYYRSRREFNQRFSTAIQNERSAIEIGKINFDFQSYLDYQGSKAPNLFDANSYLRLSMAMDLHDISRGLADPATAYKRAEAPFLVIGVEEDLLIPIDEQAEIHESLSRARRETSWQAMSSRYGHDAFLKEFDWMTPHLKRFLESE